MAKLRADINYNCRDQQKFNNEKKNSEEDDEEEENDDDDDGDGDGDGDGEEDENEINIKHLVWDFNNQGNVDPNECTSQFNDHLDEWLEMLQQEENDEYNDEYSDENEDEDFVNMNIEDIEHPAQNIDAKWELEIIFKNNLCNPF